MFEPLTAILIGSLLFGESITLRMGLGITICVAAVVFMILKPGISGRVTMQSSPLTSPNASFMDW